MEEEDGRKRRQRMPLVVLTSSPFHGHMTPILQLATALHAKGFSIAIAHSTLNPPDPSNHPNNFIFLPLSDNLSAIDSSSSFTSFVQTLNANCEPSFRQHLTRLIAKGECDSIVVIYDFLMFFAGAVAVDLKLSSIIFRSNSATYFTAFLARMQLIQKGQFLEQEFVMQDMVPGLHPLRYKDLPFSKSPIEDWHQLLAIFGQQRNPSAVVWNTLEFLEHEALSRIHEHYQVPVFAIGPLHKITPSPPITSFLEEDTSCMAWLDKQAPKSVVYVSLGSLVSVDAKVLVEMAWGLAKSKQPFLWAVRPGLVSDSEWSEFFPEDFMEETRGRGLIVKWAPQKEVLAHFAVGGFWSHCGWNSTLESISEGVPLICQPINVDQGVNARYVSYVWKIGVELEVLERGEMERMVRRVMVDEEGKEMRLKVAKMKGMVKDAMQNGGSSHESLEGLVGFILSS